MKLSKGRALLLAAAFLQTSPLLAQEGTLSPIVLEPKEKAIIGTQHYFSNDTSLRIDLPRGFNVDGSYSFYRSDLSSRTATIYVGLGHDWEEGFVNFTYSWTPLTNNYRSRALEVSGAYYTPPKDFQTTIGGTFNTTYNTQYITGTGAKKITTSLDIRQMTATLNLKQQIYDTKLTLDFGKSSYDREISRLAGRINPNSTRLQGLLGLLQGFPDMEWKFGFYQDLSSLPITLWTTYDHIKLLIAAQAQGGSSDSYMTGVDMNFLSNLTATLQYNYLTQTNQRPNDYYGAALSLRL